MTSIESTESQPFLIRMLRWLAVYGMLDGFFRMTSIGLYVADAVRANVGTYVLFSQSSWVYAGSYIGMVLNSGLELVAFAGLFYSKRWSRAALISWSVIAIVFLTLRSVSGAIAILPYYSSTQPVSPPFGTYIVTQLVSTMNGWLPPLFILWIMLQREVRELWAVPHRRAFEVIPTARAAPAQPADGDPQRPL